MGRTGFVAEGARAHREGRGARGERVAAPSCGRSADRRANCAPSGSSAGGAARHASASRPRWCAYVDPAVVARQGGAREFVGGRSLPRRCGKPGRPPARIREPLGAQFGATMVAVNVRGAGASPSGSRSARRSRRGRACSRAGNRRSAQRRAAGQLPARRERGGRTLHDGRPRRAARVVGGRQRRLRAGVQSEAARARTSSRTALGGVKLTDSAIVGAPFNVKIVEAGVRHPDRDQVRLRHDQRLRDPRRGRGAAVPAHARARRVDRGGHLSRSSPTRRRAPTSRRRSTPTRRRRAAAPTPTPSPT